MFDTLFSLPQCPKPVIAAVHSACIGGGTNMVSFADIRYCTKDAWFQVKEAELGLAADVGMYVCIFLVSVTFSVIYTKPRYSLRIF